MARPSLLTDDIRDTICRVLEEGGTRRIATAAAGISERTLYNWIKQGKAGKEPFDDFLHRVKGAEAEASLKFIKTITAASQSGVWQAAAWMLERRWPEEFSNDRRELNALKKKIAELERLLGERENQPPAREVAHAARA